MRVLVSGAGIAGLALGVSLSRKGHDVVICERSPSPRTAGYMIDFFGPGYQAAERLGLIPEAGFRMASRLRRGQASARSRSRSPVGLTSN